MVQEARAVKLQKEAEMRQEWLQGNGYHSQVPLYNYNVGLRALFLKIQNLTSADIENMPKFEYYELENWVLCYYYPYMTLVCQGGAFVAGVLYRYWYIVLDKDDMTHIILFS